jgi:pyridoxamine 5'-phosphate oxidase
MSDTAPIEHQSWLTSGDFTAADEPFRLFTAWLTEATAAEPRDPTAMTLATVDADGLPNARMVLLKGADERGFVFYTNMDSQKGRELGAHPKAALVFYWKSANRQVRLRGNVERVSDAEADAYFASRPKQAQIGAWASKQSAPLESRLAFEKAVRPRRGAASAQLVRLPACPALDRVLAGAAVPPARPYRVQARRAGRAVEQDAALSVS